MSATAEQRHTPDAGPFDLRPRASEKTLDAAVLCLHGLTGTPFDLRPVANELVERGIRSRGIVLPGHEHSPDELARVTYLDWFDAVGEALADLRAEHRRVFCTGLSLGGLLTLAHAAAGHCDAIAIIGTPLRMPLWTRLAVPILKQWQPLRPKTTGSDICDPEAKACNPGFEAMPLAAVQELIKLQARVEARLAKVEVPTLIAHGARDRTADPADADRIAAGLGSAHIERVTLERSAHIATVDYDGRALSRRIASFFEELAQE